MPQEKHENALHRKKHLNFFSYQTQARQKHSVFPGVVSKPSMGWLESRWFSDGMLLWCVLGRETRVSRVLRVIGQLLRMTDHSSRHWRHKRRPKRLTNWICICPMTSPSTLLERERDPLTFCQVQWAIIWALTSPNGSHLATKKSKRK